MSVTLVGEDGVVVKIGESAGVLPLTVLNGQIAGSSGVLVPVPGLPGLPGPAGGAAVLRTAAALSGHRVVTVDDDGELIYAECTDIGHLNRPVWFTTAAWGAGVAAAVTVVGTVTEPTWTWTPGLPVFLGSNGMPVQSPPPDAVFVRIVGYPATPTSLAFYPHPPITLNS